MGSVTINGSTSGAITLAAPAVAGSNTLTLPAATGTVITSGSSAALPVAAISATGTPSASTFLRGDGAWAGVSASGQLIRAPQVLTSGTSYTTPAGCNNILIEIVGAGGGGGGATSSGTSSPSIGGGGGGGIYGAKYAAVTPSTTYTYAIGSGGAGGGTSANGSNGGTTSITIGATTYQITGGVGGTGSPAKGGSKSAGATGTASNLDYTITPLNPASGNNGGGVDSPFGFSWGGNFQSPISSPSSGYGGKGWGAGGGGGYNPNYDGGPGLSGGAGVQGIIRIWEFT